MTTPTQADPAEMAKIDRIESHKDLTEEDLSDLARWGWSIPKDEEPGLESSPKEIGNG